jgi:3-dehydroquinate dehydratase I
MRKTLLCVSVYGSDERELAERVSKAFGRGADLVETRLDLTNISDTMRLRGLLKPYVKQLILTNRPVDEGGGSRLSDRERVGMLESLAVEGAGFVDLEVKTLQAVDATSLKRAGCRLIASWHSFEGTPETGTLAEVVEECLRHGDIAKVVTYARRREDCLKVFELYTSFDPARLVAFCMGEAGWGSRIFSMAAGAPIAYASLDDVRTAPGQLPLELMKTVRERIAAGAPGC